MLRESLLFPLCLLMNLVYANGLPPQLDREPPTSNTEQRRNSEIHNQLNPKRQIHESQNVPEKVNLQKTTHDIQNRIDEIYTFIADSERDKSSLVQGFYDHLLALLGVALALVAAVGYGTYQFVVRKVLQDVRVNGELERHRLLYGIYMNLSYHWWLKYKDAHDAVETRDDYESSLKSAAGFAEEAYSNASYAKRLAMRYKEKDLTEDYEYREVKALNHWLYHLTWLCKRDSTKQATLMYELLGKLDQFRSQIRTWKDWFNYEETYAFAIICCGESYDEKRRGVELLKQLFTDPLIRTQWKRESKTDCLNLIRQAGDKKDNRVFQEVDAIPI